MPSTEKKRIYDATISERQRSFEQNDSNMHIFDAALVQALFDAPSWKETPWITTRINKDSVTKRTNKIKSDLESYGTVRRYRAPTEEEAERYKANVWAKRENESNSKRIGFSHTSRNTADALAAAGIPSFPMAAPSALATAAPIPVVPAVPLHPVPPMPLMPSMPLIPPIPPVRASAPDHGDMQAAETLSGMKRDADAAFTLAAIRDRHATT